MKNMKRTGRPKAQYFSSHFKFKIEGHSSDFNWDEFLSKTGGRYKAW